MREIRFRAYIKGCSKIVDVDVLSVEYDGAVIEIRLLDEGSNCECVSFYENQFEIMQYTGLKDKNGKEIYEGDILSWGNNVIAKVYYADDLAMFRCSVKGTEEFDLFAFNQEASIVGNIYENKELLDE